jgi:hypothetical protein
VRDERRGVRQHLVRRGSGHDHHLDVRRGDPRSVQCLLRCLRRVRGEALLGLRHAALADPGASLDPLVADPQARRNRRGRNHRRQQGAVGTTVAGRLTPTDVIPAPARVRAGARSPSRETSARAVAVTADTLEQVRTDTNYPAVRSRQAGGVSAWGVGRGAWGGGWGGGLGAGGLGQGQMRANVTR